MNLNLEYAKRIPENIRKIILEEGFIDKAVNNDITGTPMEYLFEVHKEFLDPIGEYENWQCHRCRETVLKNWKNMQQYLIQLQNASSS